MIKRLEVDVNPHLAVIWMLDPAFCAVVSVHAEAFLEAPCIWRLPLQHLLHARLYPRVEQLQMLLV